MNRPPPSTHSHCTAFPTLSNKRRKKNVDAGAYVDPAALLAFLESQGLDEGSSSEDFFKSFQRLQTMAEEAMQLTRAVPKRKIPTSTLEMSDIRHRLGVIYKDSSPDSQWDVTHHADQKKRNGTPGLETILDDITNNEGWGLESCEALARTVVDLIIFDRLKLLGRDATVKLFRVIGEYQIDTKTLDPNITLSGRCDYVLGYGGVPGKNDLDQGLVAIELKKRYHLTAISPQLVGYLESEKVVSIVYGIATDGVNFCFHRLDHERRLRTKFLLGIDKQLIYRYIDIILESAIRATSPAVRFPGSSAGFEMMVERPLCANPVPAANSIIVQTETRMEYVIRLDEDGHAHLVYVGADDVVVLVEGCD